MTSGPAIRPPESTVRAADRGVATVYACLGCVLLLIVTGLAAQVGAASLARQRAESAADLAALAGAARVLHGLDAACAAALDVASRNGVALRSCSVVGADVLVIVNAEIRAGLLSGAATARARAGPAVATLSEQG